MMATEINKKAYREFLWNTGHFWNASKPDLLNVTHDDLDKLELDHKLIQLATQSWQEIDANFDVLAFVHHLRGIIADGDIGPVTSQMMYVPRCPMPDHAPPEGAAFDYGSEDLNEAVASYQRWAALKGSGSWPSCDPERPGVHSVRVSVLTAGFSGHQKQLMRQVLKMVEDCEAEMGQSVRHILDGDPAKAEHDVRGEYIAGGTIGYAYFPQPNTCNQVVKARIDNSYNASQYMLARLYVHEYKGHSDGLQHTRGGLMNASIMQSNSPPSWKGDPHESTKRRYFGGEPLNPTPTPTPVPPGEHNGVLVFEGRVLKIKIYE
jgi:hypothetical protein